MYQWHSHRAPPTLLTSMFTLLLHVYLTLIAGMFILHQDILSVFMFLCFNFKHMSEIVLYIAFKTCLNVSNQCITLSEEWFTVYMINSHVNYQQATDTQFFISLTFAFIHSVHECLMTLIFQFKRYSFTINSTVIFSKSLVNFLSDCILACITLQQKLYFYYSEKGISSI